MDMELSQRLTDLVILKLLFHAGNMIHLRQKNLPKFDSIRCLLGEVIEEIWTSKLLEELCPSTRHMSLVVFRGIVVPGFELFGRRTEAKQV